MFHITYENCRSYQTFQQTDIIVTPEFKEKTLKNNISYILVTESYGYGQILEICKNKEIGIKRIQRYFDLQFIQINPDFDINTEFSYLRNYRYPKNTYLENSPRLQFQVSNGVNSAYVIEIDDDKNIDEVINQLISKREN